MTTSFTAEADSDEEYVGAEEFDGPSPLFPGDTGQLVQDVRETLVTLLKRRYISSERHSKDWRIVLENEAALRTRLNDLFLDLVVNLDYEVAYKRKALSETGTKYPTLLHDQAYNREETILLVHLRRLIRSKQKAGDEAVFVDRAELVEEVGNYRPASATNQVRDEKAANLAVEALVKSEILLRTSTEDRYRVSSIIEVLLPVERVQRLAAWLRAQNDMPADAVEPTGDDPLDDLFGAPAENPNNHAEEPA